MKKENINRWMKRVTAGFLSASLVMAGTLVFPKTVEAAERDTVEYVEMAMEAGTVPVKPGYLFGGWYEDNAGKSAVKEGETPAGTTYAKFVPAYVLSVKAQVDAGATAGDGATNMRILTSLDSLDYQYVGVQVGLNNKNVKDYETTKVYDNLVIGSGTDDEKKTAAKDLFGTASQYLGAWKITDISDANDSKIVYVRPYWITMDGTRVYGLAKYVHVEDAYMDYISIPVNLMSGADTAAGLVSVGYASDQLEFIGVENGRVANDEMTEAHSVAGIVKIVGNEATVNHYETGESLFANLRFKLKDPSSLYTTNENRIMTRENFLTFGIDDSDFSDWDEKTVNAGAWSIQY